MLAVAVQKWWHLQIGAQRRVVLQVSDSRRFTFFPRWFSASSLASPHFTQIKYAKSIWFNESTFAFQSRRSFDWLRQFSLFPFLIAISFFFSCTSRYVGDYCQNLNPCYTSSGPRCQNGGNCTVSYHGGVPGFRCNCPIGFTASLCEIREQSACDSSPCQNGGSCILKSLSDYVCSCAQGYTGKQTVPGRGKMSQSEPEEANKNMSNILFVCMSWVVISIDATFSSSLFRRSFSFGHIPIAPNFVARKLIWLHSIGPFLPSIFNVPSVCCLLSDFVLCIE